MKYQSEDRMVSIRSLQFKDAEVLMEMNNNPQIAHFVVGSPRRVTLDEQMKWMEQIKYEKNTERFMIEFQDQPVGTVIISDINAGNQTANMNIKLLPVCWGRGVGTKSIRLALNYCFEEKKLECVTAHVLSYNKASLALFSKIGFQNEGILRSRIMKNGNRCDLVSFSILRNEYEEII